MTPLAVPRCILCGGSSRPLFVAKDVNRQSTTEAFAYFCCQHCGVVFLWPLPPDMGRYYTGGYHPIPSSVGELERISDGQRFKLDIIREFARDGRLIEVGPSYGAFAYLAKQAGFEVEAIELDEACCRFLNDTVGIPTRRTTSPALALAEMEPARAIALWHVLEHLPDPRRVVAAAAGCLQPGGVLIIATPNPDCLQFRTLGRYWMHLDAPRHLQLIPMEALQRYAESLGLRRVYMTTQDPGSVRCRQYSWQTSLMSACGGRASKLMMRVIGRAARVLLTPLERLPRGGVAYTMVFQKGDR